jgi:hypothetical protein
MTAHLELLVEEPSMEQFLRGVLPHLIPEGTYFNIHAHQGKADLLSKLEPRLRGYARWITEDCRIVVVVDRDADDCRRLKERLEDSARKAGLRTRTSAGGSAWQVVNRIAVEELEAWYFGNWEAVRKAYPQLSPSVPNQARYRNADAIRGGTAQAFERILKKHRYFRGGLAKTAAARDVAAHFDPMRNRSHSFRVFRDAITEAVA